MHRRNENKFNRIRCVCVSVMRYYLLCISIANIKIQSENVCTFLLNVPLSLSTLDIGSYTLVPVGFNFSFISPSVCVCVCMYGQLDVKITSSIANINRTNDDNKQQRCHRWEIFRTNENIDSRVFDKKKRSWAHAAQHQLDELVYLTRLVVKIHGSTKYIYLLNVSLLLEIHINDIRQSFLPFAYTIIFQKSQDSNQLISILPSFLFHLMPSASFPNHIVFLCVCVCLCLSRRKRGVHLKNGMQIAH